MSEINKIDYIGTEYDIGGSGGSGLTNEAKQALLACFEKVAWIDEDGQDYYDALEAALYPPANLVSISCVYTQSGTVYNTDTLDDLKSDLVVTAHYDDSSTEIITTYTLSGTLAVGTSVITVSYGGKTTTFNVTVTYADNSIYSWDFKTGVTDSKQSAVATLGNGVTQSSSGLTFDGTVNGWVYLCNLSSYASSAFTVEVDVTTVKRGSGNTSFLITLDTGSSMDVATYPAGFFWSSAWQCRSTGSNRGFSPDISDVGAFDGSTIKITFDYVNQTWTLYKDGVSQGSVVSDANSNGRDYLGLSSALSSGRNIGADTVITGVRVYEGVV